MGWFVDASPWPLYPVAIVQEAGWILERKVSPLPHWDSITGPSSPSRVVISTELSRPTVIMTSLNYTCKFQF
jgi:hypothetical protein